MKKSASSRWGLFTIPTCVWCCDPVYKSFVVFRLILPRPFHSNTFINSLSLKVIVLCCSVWSLHSYASDSSSIELDLKLVELANFTVRSLLQRRDWLCSTRHEVFWALPSRFWIQNDKSKLYCHTSPINASATWWLAQSRKGASSNITQYLILHNHYYYRSE